MDEINKQRENILRNEINKSLVNRFQQLCDFREIQNLYKVLNPDERIIQAVNGMIPGHNNDTGLVILTQQRVIFFDHSLFFSSDSPSISLSKLNSATAERGVIHGQVVFDDGSHPYAATRILAWKCQKFANTVQAEVNKYNENHSSNNQSSTENIVNQLVELRKLLNNNTITKAEFNKEKARILNNN